MVNISHRIRELIFCFTILLAGWVAPAVFAEGENKSVEKSKDPVRIEWVEIHADSLGTHLRVPFSGNPSTMRLDNPPRWAVDIKPAWQGLGKTLALWTSQVDLGVLKTLRVGQFRMGPEPVVRLTLVLNESRELSVKQNGRELLLKLEPKPGEPLGSRRFGKSGGAGTLTKSPESGTSMGMPAESPDESPDKASVETPIETPTEAPVDVPVETSTEESVKAPAETQAESPPPSDTQAISSPPKKTETDKKGASQTNPVAPPDALPQIDSRSLPAGVELVSPAEPDSAEIATREAKRHLMTGGEVSRHATGYLLKKSQESLLEDRPDHAMDLISRGLRLYKGTAGTNALNLLWHLTVPLTNRPAAAAMFEEEDAREGHLIAQETYFHLVQIALTLQNLKASKRVLERWTDAYEPDEPWIDSVLDYTRMSLSRGRWEEAAAWLDRIPGDGMSPRQMNEERILRSEAYEGLGRLDEAEKVLNEVTEVGSKELAAEARLRRADLLCLRGDYISALPLYTKAVDEISDPEHRIWAIYRTGVCREEAGNLEGARESFLQLMREAPQSNWTQYARRHVELLSTALVDEPAAQ